MSDLISRSNLLKEIETWGGCVEALHEYIEKMPTAYDIDKVVAELEDRVNEANNNCLCEMHENGHTLDFENENGRIKGLKEAIEIVKQGGVGKEVD